VLQGRRYPGKLTSPTDGLVHVVGKATQRVRERIRTAQRALERRTDFPRVQEIGGGVHTAHHIQRVAASAARRKLH